MSDVCIDPLLNRLVPECHILSKADEEKLLASKEINKVQLPKMRVTDAVAKKLGAKPGDVVCIKRKDAGTNLYYRRVTKY